MLKRFLLATTTLTLTSAAAAMAQDLGRWSTSSPTRPTTCAA